MVPADPHRRALLGRAGVLHSGVVGRVQRADQAYRGPLQVGRAAVGELLLELPRAGQAVPVDDGSADGDVPGHGVLARGPVECGGVQVGRAAAPPGRAELAVGQARRGVVHMRVRHHVPVMRGRLDPMRCRRGFRMADRPRRGGQRGGPDLGGDLGDVHDEHGDDHQHRRRRAGQQPEHPALAATPLAPPGGHASLADQQIPAWRRRPHSVRLNGTYAPKEALSRTWYCFVGNFRP